MEKAFPLAGTEPNQICSASRDLQTLEGPFSCFLARNFLLKSLCLRDEQNRGEEILSALFRCKQPQPLPPFWGGGGEPSLRRHTTEVTADGKKTWLDMGRE